MYSEESNDVKDRQRGRFWIGTASDIVKWKFVESARAGQGIQRIRLDNIIIASSITTDANVTIHRGEHRLTNSHFPNLPAELYKRFAGRIEPRLCHFYRDSPTVFVHISPVILAIDLKERERETRRDGRKFEIQVPHIHRQIDILAKPNVLSTPVYTCIYVIIIEVNSITIYPNNSDYSRVDL